VSKQAISSLKRQTTINTQASVKPDTIRATTPLLLAPQTQTTTTLSLMLTIAVGMRRHPICANAVHRIHAPCLPGIKKVEHANPIAPFSTTIRD
jgi:hypothetical protein